MSYLFDSNTPISLPECPVGSQDLQQRKQHAAPLTDDAKSRPRGRRGKIMSVNAASYAYEVVLDGGGSQPVTMGRLMTDLSDATILPVGATVAVSYDYGVPLIIGVIPITSDRSAQPGVAPFLTEDRAEDEADPIPDGAYCRPPHLPDNLCPQDKVLVSPDGNMIGALSGGINTMQSGMAQVRTHALNDLVEIVCRNYRHISDFGITEVKNNNGKISLSLRGGTDQANECGSDQENWTVRLDLNGADLFRFELTSPTGTTLFKLAVNNDGKVELYGADGLDLSGGRDREEAVLGDRKLSITGSDAKTVDGNQTRTVTGNRDTSTSGSESRVVGNDLTVSAIRHLTESIGGNHTETITGGNPLVATPLNVARKTRVVNGSWEIDIGDPLSGANPAALAGFKLHTFNGDISLQAKVLGDVDIGTTFGNVELATKVGLASLTTALGVANVDGTTVQLGPLAAATHPLILGIPYSAGFTSFLTTLVAACNATAGAVMEPGLIGFGAAVGAAAAALLGQIPTMLSTKSFTA